MHSALGAASALSEGDQPSASEPSQCLRTRAHPDCHATFMDGSFWESTNYLFHLLLKMLEHHVHSALFSIAHIPLFRHVMAVAKDAEVHIVGARG